MSGDRVALVTGVSRRVGIGAAIARRFAGEGYRLLLTGLPAYDETQPYGGDPDGVTGLLAELDTAELDTAELDTAASYVAADLREPGAPEAVVHAAIERFGALDVLVANHTYSTRTVFGSLDPTEIDRHLTVNVRATMLLAQAYAAVYDEARGGGRVVLFSSGQRLGPMPGELAYAASKAAVENLTGNLSYLLAPRGITVNCVNPGPTDTGWLGVEDAVHLRGRFPTGRIGRPDDAARLVAWLCSADAEWINGQVVDSEGGFRRWD
jgi:3-oxoacyl-[acyl-carrier protein] reductase